MAKVVLNDLTTNYGSQALHNANNTTIEDELNNKVLYRNNPSGEPNQMENDLDMNSNDVLNGGNAFFSQITVNGNILDVDNTGVTTLPDQTGQDGKLLTTSGGSASWTANTTSSITHSEDGGTYNLDSYLQNRHVISVRDFGAVGDGVTDDSAAIQSAIDAAPSNGRAAIYLPAGLYIVSSTLTIDKDNLVFFGDGINATTLVRTGDYGTTLKVDTTNDYTDYIVLRDFGISNNSTNPVTTGAEIELIACVAGTVENVRTTGKSLIGIQFKGCLQMALNNINVRLSGTYNSSRKGLDFLPRPAGYPGSPGNNSAIKITNSEIDTAWLPGDVDDASMEYGLYAEALDGLMVSNSRIGGAKNSSISLSGSNASNNVAHAMFDNCFLDLVQTRNVLLSGTSALTFETITFSNCLFSGGSDSVQGISIQGNPTGVRLVGNRFRNHGDNAIALTDSASQIVINGNDFENFNTNDAAANEAIGAAGAWTGEDLIISNNTIDGQSTAGVGIRLNAGTNLIVIGNRVRGNANGITVASGVTDYQVIGNNFKDNSSTDIIDSSGVVEKIWKDNLHDDSTSIASAATITIPPRGPFYTITGTTNITSIVAWPAGTEITLMFSGALTLTDGSNLKLAGNFVTTADDTISLISDGTNWVEKSRSAN